MKVRRKKIARRARILKSEILFRGRIFDVRRDRVIEPSGVDVVRETVMHAGAVVVLPVLADGRIVLIRQYRHAVGQYFWELVAGRKERGEGFSVGALRELEEETGYRARRITKLMTIFPSPGLLRERTEIFVAEGLTKGAPRPEDDEKITSRIFTLREAERWIRAGRIADAKSVAGILYYARFVAGTK